MAWQLGGAEGYAFVAESDAKSISPGSEVLGKLFKKYSPCLILIDEWVAYFRGIYNVSDTPAGSFETNLTFAQALTEAASATEGSLVVATLPASQIEIGGQGGQEALDRLKNTFGRVQTSWTPASSEESFEIIRRRLFEEIPSDAHPAKDVVIQAFSRMYQSNSGEFPSASREAAYKRRLEAAYPIHPELFERLYNDWGGLDKFQRTRGVLRLMASVIHALWERGDGGLLIMPSSVPMDHGPVQSELVRYLDESWSSIISRDIDGPTSIPFPSTTSFKILAGILPHGEWPGPSTWVQHQPTKAITQVLTRAESVLAALSPARPFLHLATLCAGWRTKLFISMRTDRDTGSPRNQVSQVLPPTVRKKSTPMRWRRKSLNTFAKT